MNYYHHKHLPKVIHQIWIGDQSKRPDEWINTWKLDGWEHKLWTENEIDELGLVNREQYDYYYNKGIWHGAADVARIEILYRLGGIYMDADSERLKALEGGFLYSNLFICDESSPDVDEDWYANGIIGAQPGSPTLKEYIKRLGELPATEEALEPAWLKIGGGMLTPTVQAVNEAGTMIVATFVFLPEDYAGIKHDRHEEAIARQHWGSTKGLY